MKRSKIIISLCVLLLVSTIGISLYFANNNRIYADLKMGNSELVQYNQDLEPLLTNRAIVFPGDIEKLKLEIAHAIAHKEKVALLAEAEAMGLDSEELSELSLSEVQESIDSKQSELAIELDGLIEQAFALEIEVDITNLSDVDAINKLQAAIDEELAAIDTSQTDTSSNDNLSTEDILNTACEQTSSPLSSVTDALNSICDSL